MKKIIVIVFVFVCFVCHGFDSVKHYQIELSELTMKNLFISVQIGGEYFSISCDFKNNELPSEEIRDYLTVLCIEGDPKDCNYQTSIMTEKVQMFFNNALQCEIDKAREKFNCNVETVQFETDSQITGLFRLSTESGFVAGNVSESGFGGTSLKKNTQLSFGAGDPAKLMYYENGQEYKLHGYLHQDEMSGELMQTTSHTYFGDGYRIEYSFMLWFSLI